MTYHLSNIKRTFDTDGPAYHVQRILGSTKKKINAIKWYLYIRTSFILSTFFCYITQRCVKKDYLIFCLLNGIDYRFSVCFWRFSVRKEVHRNYFACLSYFVVSSIQRSPQEFSKSSWRHGAKIQHANMAAICEFVNAECF